MEQGSQPFSGCLRQWGAAHAWRAEGPRCNPQNIQLKVSQVDGDVSERPSPETLESFCSPEQTALTKMDPESRAAETEGRQLPMLEIPLLKHQKLSPFPHSPASCQDGLSYLGHQGSFWAGVIVCHHLPARLITCRGKVEE